VETKLTQHELLHFKGFDWPSEHVACVASSQFAFLVAQLQKAAKPAELKTQTAERGRLER
jgi:hypothetical protein